MRKDLLTYYRKTKNTNPLSWKLSDITYITVCLLIVAGFALHIKSLLPAPTKPVDGSTVAGGIISPVWASEPSLPVLLLPTPTIKPRTTVQEIMLYIIKTFEPEGKAVVVEAINCFYSESKFDPKAYNYNRWNDTEDKGIAQINSIHDLDDAYDYRKNIDKAYEIYKHDGWSAWYGKGCGRLAYK